MRKLLFFLVLVILGDVAYSYDNTYAIVIGVADYKNFSAYSGDLTYTVSDARKFAAFLQSKNGGSVPASNIFLLLDANASKANILAKARALFAKAKTNDRVIFYFSGHGDKGCFLPYDCGRDGSNMLYFSEIKSVFRYAKCNTKLLFADACFAGSMKSVKKEMASKVITHEAKVASKMNIAVMMSCTGDETSMESGELKQGIFTYYLMQGLGGRANTDGSKYMTIQELFYYVYHKVRAKAASIGHTQTPVLFGNFDLRLVVGKI